MEQKFLQWLKTRNDVGVLLAVVLQLLCKQFDEGKENLLKGKFKYHLDNENYEVCEIMKDFFQFADYDGF